MSCEALEERGARLEDRDAELQNHCERVSMCVVWWWWLAGEGGLERARCRPAARKAGKSSSTSSPAGTKIEVARQSNGPATPYDWPVIHEGDASTSTTSAGRTSKASRIVRASPEQ